MFISLFNLISYLSHRSRDENKEPQIHGETDGSFSTSEGNESYLSYSKSLGRSFINQEIELSEEFVERKENDIFVRMFVGNSKLHTMKTFLSYFFCSFHLFTYAVALLILGWYFGVKEITNASIFILSFLFFSFIIIVYNHIYG